MQAQPQKEKQKSKKFNVSELDISGQNDSFEILASSPMPRKMTMETQASPRKKSRKSLVS